MLPTLPRRLLAGLMLAAALVRPAPAQSIDTSMAGAVIGEPVAMTLLVRAFDWPASHLLGDCLTVRLQHADSGEPLAPLHLALVATGQDNQVQVRISSDEIVREPVLQGRIELLCGARYGREFTVLADPPRARAGLRHAPPTPRSARIAPPRHDPAGAPLAPAREPAVTAARPSPITRSADDDEARVLRIAAAVAAMLPAARERPEDERLRPAWMAGWNEEQQQTRATLAALQARIERSERTTWHDAVLVGSTLAGLAVGLLLVRLVTEVLLPRWSTGPDPARSARSRRRRRTREVATTREAPDPLGIMEPILPDFTPSPERMADPTPEALRATPDQAAHQAASPPAPAAPAGGEDRVSWRDSNFGSPDLGCLASRDLLGELETQGDDCPLGCVVILEQRLLEGPGRCPRLLLRLLALYRQLEQPWNHERVAAQLEALYNVRVPPMDGAVQAGGGRSLEEQPETLERVTAAWSHEDQAGPAVETLLLRPTAVEELDLPAFEELLMLHELLLRRGSVSQHRAAAWELAA